MSVHIEVLVKLVLQLPPQKLLAQIPAEQRLAGLDRDQAVLALPMEALRALSDDYIRSLSPETQTEIQRRLAQNGHADPPSNGG